MRLEFYLAGFGGHLSYLFSIKKQFNLKKLKEDVNLC